MSDIQAPGTRGLPHTRGSRGTPLIPPGRQAVLGNDVVLYKTAWDAFVPPILAQLL